MKLVINGREALVRFSHSPEKYRRTSCDLYFLEGEEKFCPEAPQTPYAYGISLCHFRDNFERRIGRKLSFTRMLEDLVKRLQDDEAFTDFVFSPKELRTYAWGEYIKNFRV